jgi:hypothetical protein
MKRGWATMGKRALAIGLGVLLVVAAATPVEAYWRAGFWVGLGAGALLTAPFWSPYGYYPYPYPYYSPYYPPSYPYYAPYPVYAYPAPSTGAVPPAATPTTPTTPTPSLLTPPPTAGEGAVARKCETVWVEGHYETHVGPSGQGSTVWIPGVSQQICQ